MLQRSFGNVKCSTEPMKEAIRAEVSKEDKDFLVRIDPKEEDLCIILARIGDNIGNHMLALKDINERLNKIDMRLDNQREHILLHRDRLMDIPKDTSKQYDLMHDTACLIGGHDERLNKLESVINDLIIENSNLRCRVEEIENKPQHKCPSKPSENKLTPYL